MDDFAKMAARRSKLSTMKRKPLSSTQATPWHTLSSSECFGTLHSGPAGIAQSEAEHRLAKNGFNEIDDAQALSVLGLLLDQFKNVLILILLIATGLSAYLGHGMEAAVIAVIVLFSIILGFVQEYRAGRAMEALRSMAAPVAVVIRDGEETTLPARWLVPGDVVLLRTGDRVPADLRLLQAVNLQLEEAALTGESLPVEKQIEPLAAAQLSVGDRNNMAYSGTAVSYGRGTGLVVATGMLTEFGRIVGSLQETESRRTPLQKNLDRVGGWLALAAFLIVTVIVSIGIYRGEPFVEMLIFGVALAVAAVPEALPAVVTISLSIGARKMVRRHALIRRLPAVETLGCTSVICSDKTGTLTRDEMTARRIYSAGRMLEISGAGYSPSGEFSLDGQAVAADPLLVSLLEAGILASDARIVEEESGTWRVKGDPTEGALIVAAAKAGLDKLELERRMPRIGEIPFTSETKRMTTLHDGLPGGGMAFSKGAVEVILASCSSQLTDAGEFPLDAAQRGEILRQAQTMANQALRVLALARKPATSLAEAEQSMCFLGLVGMIDPPRPESRDAIKTCEQAGIRVVMITGDHPLTARAVAKELGILKADCVVTGAELETMSDAELARQVDDIEVYARVSPQHKLRVVTALQQLGYIVAMTGDGVNDAPALKKADIGVAMGISGTDVSREAAAMTLTDDNFQSIVAAVEEGRGIYSNIKKYLVYLLSSNIGEIGLMATTSLMGLPLPLSAVQILYVNLATDGLPALALAVDPAEEGVMQRPPRDPQQGIFNVGTVTLLLVGGLWSALANAGLYLWALGEGHEQKVAMTMVFISLVLIQFFKAYSFRTEGGIWRRPFANRWLNLAVFWEMAWVLVIVYVPFFQELFGTYALDWDDWAVLMSVAISVVPVLEVAKWFGRRESGRCASLRSRE